MFRLIVFVLFFLHALLTILPAPTHVFWYASIIITEFPWIFMGLMIGLLVFRFGSDRFDGWCLGLGVVALLLYAFPVIGAYGISKNIDRNLTNAFNPVIPKARAIEYPFRFGGMFAREPDEQPWHVVHFPSQDADLTFDYYPPKDTAAKPCVVVIHGGSWSGGDSRDLPELNQRLAAEGYPVVALNYRLAPQSKFPAPLADVYAALRFIRAHSIDLRIDTTNIILLGRSAGGEIALTAAYALRDPGIKGVVDLYGPTDLVNAWEHPSRKAVIDSRRVIADYLGGTPADSPWQYRLASPAAWVNPHSVPTLIIHGRHDPVVSYRQAELLDRRLADNRVRHYLLGLPWGTHGCDYTLKGPSGQLIVYAVRRFIEAVVRPADTVVVESTADCPGRPGKMAQASPLGAGLRAYF